MNVIETQRERMRQYLLGMLPEVEQTTLENEFLNDDEQFEQMVAAENELVDAYVRNQLTAEERRQFDKLRDWRHRTARQESIPAYLVCSDKTLEHLIIARPRTVEDLSGIFGLGDSKISRYGVEMLAQLTQG